ncbi:MAG: EF-P 5-aminopentanol modification-associated protein YfmH [Saccharofermentanales bacterium]
MKRSLFKKEERTDELTGAKIITYRHPCGLVVNMIPKPKFSKKFAGFLIPYGSIHNEFSAGGDVIGMPDGTAHYLEHCIFSKNDEGGLLSQMSALGACANAYTSHTHTMYYFTTVVNFNEAFDLYFKALIFPYLEIDRVEEERDVIIQELDMYKDDPDNRCFDSMIASLYFNHAIRNDIGGTKESVSEITPGHLKTIQKYFYTPAAMSITVAGDIDEKDILAVLEEYLDSASEFSAQPDYIFGEEPSGVKNAVSESEMDVSMESFLIGIKNPEVNQSAPKTKREKVLNQKCGQLFCEIVLGNSSEIYEKLYSEGLINDSFGFQYQCEETYSFIVMGGESPDPKTAAKKLYELLLERFGTAIDPMEFEIQKRVAAGNFIRSLDSVEHCGMSAAIAGLSGMSIFDYPEIYDMMDPESMMESMRFICDKDQKTESFIFKKGIKRDE